MMMNQQQPPLAPQGERVKINLTEGSKPEGGKHRGLSGDEKKKRKLKKEKKQSSSIARQ
jgi:hypothetical protein